MALTPGVAVRTNDSSGLNIKTFIDGGGDHVQGVALVDEDGDHLQIESWYDSSAAEEVRVVKGASGRLHRVLVHSISASTAYIQLFDHASTPTGTPLFKYPIAAGATIEIDLGLMGRKFSNGIVIAPSSTRDTYTALSANEMYYTVGYK
jgi:hypothetical protein